MSDTGREIKCTLCNSIGELFSVYNGKEYYNCPCCKSVFMNPKDYLTRDKEEKRYKEHNNDVYDSRYQEFVSPIVKEVINDFRPQGIIGLDYGCGTGPVISKLLKDEGYELNLYDPFFENHIDNLKIKYDFIVCCEVMEHFHNPETEFYRLYSLMRKGGVLFMKTQIYSADINFDAWYYKNDPTHVFFYTVETLAWIMHHFKFLDLIIQDDYIKLIAKK